MDLPLPARRGGPSAFFRSYLPSLLSALETAGSVVPRPWHVALEAVIADQEFSVTFSDGRMRVNKGGSSIAGPPILLRLICDEASWEIGALDVLPMVVRKLQQSLLDAVRDGAQRRVDTNALAALPGRVDVEYTDDAGDLARCRIEVAPDALARGSHPRAGICAADRDLWQLLRGGSAFASLVRSRAQLTGDTAYLLRFLNALGDPG